MKKKIKIHGISIRVEAVNEDDYVSLTDIARQSERRPREVINDWIRNSQTLIFLEEWEKLHNPHFKGGQMPPFRLEAQKNRKAISPKAFIQKTNAVGLISYAGRHGGTLCS